MKSEGARVSLPLRKYSLIQKNHKEPYAAISSCALCCLQKRSHTGGGLGIGFAISNAFEAAGPSHLTILGDTIASLEAIKSVIESRTPNTHVSIYIASLIDYDAVKVVFAAEHSARREFATVVLCAGSLHNLGSVVDVSKLDYSYKNSFNLNVHRNIHLTRQYLKVPSTHKNPKTVLDISSATTHDHFPVVAIYAITKAAFMYNMVHLDLEFHNTDLKTFSVHQGMVFTGMATRAGVKETNLPPDYSKMI